MFSLCAPGNKNRHALLTFFLPSPGVWELQMRRRSEVHDWIGEKQGGWQAGRQGGRQAGRQAYGWSFLFLQAIVFETSNNCEENPFLVLG